MIVKVVVKDANIIIDLEQAGVLEIWLSMPVETHTTDFIVRQLSAGKHEAALSQVRSGNIREYRCSAEDLESIDELFQTFGGGPDVNDCSVLFLAGKLDAVLLTGDRALRRESEVRRVEVHGTIWIFDQMIEAGKIDPVDAARKLQDLLDSGRFLPQEICQKRIQMWELL